MVQPLSAYFELYVITIKCMKRMQEKIEFSCRIVLSSPVHKLHGNVSTTLGFFGNFQLAEQLSMHLATSKVLCLYSYEYCLEPRFLPI